MFNCIVLLGVLYGILHSPMLARRCRQRRVVSSCMRILHLAYQYEDYRYGPRPNGPVYPPPPPPSPDQSTIQKRASTPPTPADSNGWLCMKLSTSPIPSCGTDVKPLPAKKKTPPNRLPTTTISSTLRTIVRGPAMYVTMFTSFLTIKYKNFSGPVLRVQANLVCRCCFDFF